MSYNELSDKELLRACIEADPEAGDYFVEKYSRLIYSCIHETLKMYSADYLREDIEDLHNNIFVLLFKDSCNKLKQFRGDNNCTVASWLKIIAMNTTRNVISRKKTFVSLDDDAENTAPIINKMPYPQSPVLEKLINAEEAHLLNRSIDALKADDKLVLKYLYNEELLPDEIAKIMNITTNTVYSKISRIKKRLQENLKKKKLL
jgi:RNA polymerase sigma factor (sigma-70 family)